MRSAAGLLSVVPLYFVTHALQPVMALLSLGFLVRAPLTAHTWLCRLIGRACA